MLKWFCFIALLANSYAKDLPLDDEILKFTLDGSEHSESRKVDGNIVTVTDLMDGFLVTLDYERDILMIKNLTSEICFFSRLENIPIQKSEKTPLMVKEISAENDLVSMQQDVDKVVFSPVGKIPSSYVLLTNDVTVAGECVSKPSYWLDMKVATRQRRECDAVCGSTIIVAGILIGVFVLG